jgi:hypothetical protein
MIKNINICEDNIEMYVKEIRREIIWTGFIWFRTERES